MPWHKVAFPSAEQMARAVAAAGWESRVGWNSQEFRQPGTKRWLRIQQAWEVLKFRRVLTDAERKSGVVCVEKERPYYA